jgi:hypothetical protein
MAVDLRAGSPSVYEHLGPKGGSMESEVVERMVRGLELDHSEGGGFRRDVLLECTRA